MQRRLSVEILTDTPPVAASARIVYGASPLQFADLRLPSGVGPHPLVVFVHGGYWQSIYNLAHAGHLCVDLAAHGAASWNVEYRRVGDPRGEWPSPLVDVVAALDALALLASEHRLDLTRVVLAGHSAGGQLALLAARVSLLPLAGVVSLAGVVDLRAIDRSGDDRGMIRRLLGAGPEDDPQRWDEASPRSQLPLGFRYVLACGTEDVHWQLNREAAEAGRAAGDDVELLPLQGAGHFELIDPQSQEWPVIRSKLFELISVQSRGGS